MLHRTRTRYGAEGCEDFHRAQAGGPSFRPQSRRLLGQAAPARRTDQGPRAGRIEPWPLCSPSELERSTSSFTPPGSPPARKRGLGSVRKAGGAECASAGLQRARRSEGRERNVEPPRPSGHPAVENGDDQLRAYHTSVPAHPRASCRALTRGGRAPGLLARIGVLPCAACRSPLPAGSPLCPFALYRPAGLFPSS